MQKKLIVTNTVNYISFDWLIPKAVLLIIICHMGYCHLKADERLGDPPTRCNQKPLVIITRRMYWRQASIQDGQVPGDATVLVIFRHRLKIIAFLESLNFSTCVYVQIFNFRDGHVTFWYPSGDYICKMSGHRLSRLAKGTPSVSTFHRYHWFGVKLFPVGCAPDCRWVL